MQDEEIKDREEDLTKEAEPDPRQEPEQETPEAETPDEAQPEESETLDDPSEAEPQVEAEEAEPGEKKGFFRRNKKDKRDTQIEELTDRVKRQMAEFDNFRKRTEKEKAAMFEVGAKSVIEKILPVVDNFERGLAAVPEGTEDPYVEGMEKIYKQLISTLESLEVKPIEAVGQPFDPNFHNAVMHVDDESLGENVVAEELQRGYLYREHVVRHSMVKVAN